MNTNTKRNTNYILKEPAFQKYVGPFQLYHKGFGSRIRTFWDHLWTFLGLIIVLMKMPKRQKLLSCDVTYFKICLMLSRYERAREYETHAHDTLCSSKLGTAITDCYVHCANSFHQRQNQNFGTWRQNLEICALVDCLKNFRLSSQTISKYPI